MKSLLTKRKPKVFYYNVKNKNAITKFSKNLYELLCAHTENGKHLILVCIGSDRATGDCLGPIIGYKLSRLSGDRVTIFGTLEHPVHAQNLPRVVTKIKEEHPDSFVVAIDASLGKPGHIGYVTLGQGPIHPGVGVNKALPAVGDIFITGIVNTSGLGAGALLQTTRLGVVMELADFISRGLGYHIQNDWNKN